MEDSKPILENGVGTPYLAIFNSSRKPIIDPKNKLPIGVYVTNFLYEYSEEDDDTFKITLECDNTDLLDIPELGNQMPLLLQWGWIFPNGTSDSGPVRKVVIRDTEINFTESGVKCTIKGTDAFSLTKVMPSNLEDKTFLQWLKNNLGGKYTVEIVDYNTDFNMKLEKVE